MKVIFVGAGPGDPELLTVKAARLLQNCHCCIYAGSLVNPQVLQLLPADAHKHDSASLDLGQMVDIYREAQIIGIDVIRLHSGDASIYGAIREQMNELDRMGIEYEVVPGVSSFQATAAALKTELTAPEVSQTIILTRAAGRTPVPDGQDIDRLAQTQSTLCLFLSVEGIRDLAQKLSRHYGEDCPVGVVFRASWPDQKIICSTLKDIASKIEAENITKTAMIIVGQALARDIPNSKLYDRSFSHGCRKGDRR
jgi:precorrin-4/cobalt-precorrin-4 C11-methyltransferase